MVMRNKTVKVQVSLDFLSIDKALEVGKVASRAGADWIEAGTPLITFQGVKAIEAVSEEFPDKIIVADYKALDGVAKYVKEAARRGAHIATVAAVATDASIRQGVKAARESGIEVCADLYAIYNPAQRARELEQIGVDYVMIHLGADEKSENPARDPLEGLFDVVKAVNIPVGVVVFTIDEATEAIRQGARFIVVGHPLLSSENLAKVLSNFIKIVKEAAAAR